MEPSQEQEQNGGGGGQSPAQANSTTTPPAPTPIFEPQDLSTSPPTFTLPSETWTSLLSSAVAFEPHYFVRVMANLIQHPEIASTYLFRAEILYDSFHDPEGTFLRHVKREFLPRAREIEGWERTQVIVRRMVPRNPARDRELVQTCAVFRRVGKKEGEEENLVLYWPHVDAPEEVPFYHPTVQALAFLHVWRPHQQDHHNQNQAPGTLSIHYHLFPTQALTTRLQRTALALLTLINKHSEGQKRGYTKRVHHDQLVPQARFQDTYTRLKAVYAKALIQGWVEQTPPGKHVFEDLGIAAFLIELWRGMYELGGAGEGEGEGGEGKEEAKKKPPFPGFVDIGCGNGVLVHVLLSEGFRGWGFDARRRKTWDTFPAASQTCLKEMVLVPEVLTQSLSSSSTSTFTSTTTPATTTPTTTLSSLLNANAPENTDATKDAYAESELFHNGIFPPGTFVISNHADELTPWTPLLASLSGSPFLAIPCCSHNLAGAKFRAPAQKAAEGKGGAKGEGEGEGKGAKSGSLKQLKQPSAYASLCDWVARLAADVGYLPEKEMLRIPSTRNAGIVGRVGGGGRAGGERGELNEDERKERVRALLVREMAGLVAAGESGPLDNVAREWVQRAGKLVRGQGGGH